MFNSKWSRRRFIKVAGLGAVAAAPLPYPALAQSRDEMATQALNFLESLTAEQRREVLYAFTAAERRDWHYTPRRRPGLTLKAMSPEQRERVWSLLGSALSAQGLEKSRDVIQLEGILGELSGNPGYRDPENYAIVLFGDPAVVKPWGWRFEGHHLSLSFTVVPNQGVAITPAFFGANPATVPKRHSHAGLKVLGAEETLGFQLINGLPETQRSTAILAADSLGNIVTGPGREDSLRRVEGLALAAMNETHRQQTVALIEEYVNNMRPDLAKQELAKIRAAGIESIHFAWAGSLTPGRPHYYRLHGPTLVIEYDNTQNGANHVHSVWHEPGNGFGEDLLKAHYQASHRFV